jgi:iron uptake system EfeUOB component EfeO/EfeM
MLRHAVLALAVAALAVTAAGCGSDGPARPTTTAAAQPYSALDPHPSQTGTPDPRDFARPIAAYRAHVRTALGRMEDDLQRLRAAVAAGDLSAARAAWLRADWRYETIGAAYGAFGDLDAAINTTTAGLAGGARSPRFVGLHRVELALWGRASTRDAARPARDLVVAVDRLRTHVGRAEIDPLDYALRAHEVLEDSLQLQLSGRASPWASAALTALDANVDGTRVVLRSLEPMIDKRNPGVTRDATRSLDRLDHVLSALRAHGRLPRWDGLGQRDREQVSGATAAAAEALAYVPELVDPRAPRPSQRAVGDGA